MKLLLYIAVFCLIGQFVYAEETKTNDTTLFQDTLETKTRDTTLFQDTLLLTGTSPITDSTNFEKRLLQNPTKALFKSMVVPGWGQFGNKRKFKALLFFSFDVWMISKALDHKKKAQDLWDIYDSFDDVATRNKYYDLYTIERNNRNKFTWYAVITSFFAMFDAYVDAHLSGFPKEKEQKFSLDFTPSESSGAFVSLSIRF